MTGSSALPISEGDIDKVDAAADHVQALAPLPRALLSREALVRAAGGTLDFGPAEARLRKVLALVGRRGMVAISLALLAWRFFAERRIGKATCVPISVFVGIAAMREPLLLKDISSRFGLKPIIIDQRTSKGFSVLPQPNLRLLMRHWIQIIRESLLLLENPNPHFNSLDMMSTLTMRCHELSHLVAIFETAKLERRELKLFFSNHDLPAHAACLVGLETNFYQHGFLSPAAVFPDFSTMFALTQYEARHVARRNPKLRTEVITSSQEKNSTLSRTIAVAGIYGYINPDIVKMLANLAKNHGYQVVIRPHPNGESALWSGINTLSNVAFDSEGSFEEFFVKWRPSFIATWHSTTLLDGLMMGAVPVTFSTGKGKLVLPLREIALAFPEKRELLESCLSDTATRFQVYDTLQAVIMR